MNSLKSYVVCTTLLKLNGLLSYKALLWGLEHLPNKLAKCLAMSSNPQVSHKHQTQSWQLWYLIPHPWHLWSPALPEPINIKSNNNSKNTFLKLIQSVNYAQISNVWNLKKQTWEKLMIWNAFMVKVFYYYIEVWLDIKLPAVFLWVVQLPAIQCDQTERNFLIKYSPRV